MLLLANKMMMMMMMMLFSVRVDGKVSQYDAIFRLP